MQNDTKELLQSNFAYYVRYAFRKTHSESLGEQPYLDVALYNISKFIQGELLRLLINMPPQHLKSFVASICLITFILGRNARTRIILVTYNDAFADKICRGIRNIMLSDWYAKIFPTRIRDGHSRSNDFETTKGGGVFAASATGAITGRSADLIVYDDPHSIHDWNKPERLREVCENFHIVESRLNNRAKGRIIVIAHRVSNHDLSAYLLEIGGWHHVRFPFIANRRREFRYGKETWIRKKGELLQPKAYPKKEVDKVVRLTTPPFEMLYQQDERSNSALSFKPEHFPIFDQVERSKKWRVVLSVDPNSSDRSDSSYAVIQVWQTDGEQHFLIDQFREPCDFTELKSAFIRLANKHTPSYALIEDAAVGPALLTEVRRGAPFEIKGVLTGNEPKPERLRRHAGKIRAKRVSVKNAPWADKFIDEVVNFPAEFDDQVDAMTQFLDFMDTKPNLPEPRPRGTAVLVTATSLSQRRWGW